MERLCICGHNTNQHNKPNQMCDFNNGYWCKCKKFRDAPVLARSETLGSLLKRTKEEIEKGDGDDYKLTIEDFNQEG